MNPTPVADLNASLRGLSPQELTRWAVERGAARAIVTTNFRPYEAVILHLAVQAKADIPALWVDHGTNLPETYQFAEKCRAQLGLNLQAYLPKMTAAHWLALNGGNVPMPDEVERVESFSRAVITDS